MEKSDFLEDKGAFRQCAVLMQTLISMTSCAFTLSSLLFILLTSFSNRVVLCLPNF